MDILIDEHLVLVDDDDYPIISRHTLSLHNGYCQIALDHKHRVGLHRFVFGFVPLGYVVDHINRNKLDCRKENLRLATKAENAQNIERGKSGYFGVVKNKYHYGYAIASDNTLYRVNHFKTLEDAVWARDAACLFLHGEFAVLNNPECPPIPMPPEMHHLAVIGDKKSRQAMRNIAKIKKAARGAAIGVKVDKRNGNYVAAAPRTAIDIGPGPYIGTFKTKEEAMIAHDSVSKFMFGKDAPLNFPDRDIEPKSIEFWRRESRNLNRPSKYKGVLKGKKKSSPNFAAVVYPFNDTIYLGVYEDKEEAAAIRDSAQLYLTPDMNRYKLNFPDMHTIACDPEIIRNSSLVLR